ncbi:leucine-rich repeat domain-containing protein [uncultured Eubacterium sp.]|uniref:leucine-rich repeat domain-containing protein n=1 Tax=uncultured Eubacterium sp. TaxID=165185 RepID=UPI00338E3AF7
MAKGNKYFKVYKGALYNKNMTKLLYYPRKNKDNKTFVIPKSVKIISDTAFTDNCYIEKLVIKGDVRDGYDEGGSCTSMRKLKSVVFKTKQTSDYPLRFSDCKELEEVKLAEGTKKIVYEQFSNCCNLVKINLPESLESIVDNAFEGCDKLVLPKFDESKLKHID